MTIIESKDLVSRAEERMPLSHTNGTPSKSFVDVPVKPVPSKSGGFQMTEGEKAAAQHDAAKKVFGN